MAEHEYRRPWWSAVGLLAALTIAVGSCVTALPAGGATPKPTVSPIKSSPAVVTGDGTVVLGATVTSGATCTFSAKQVVTGLPVTVPCGSGTATTTVMLPWNTGKKALTYVFHLAVAGPTRSVNAHPVKVEVLPRAGGTGFLAGAAQVTGDGAGYCTVLVSTGVDCWGDDTVGQVGNGVIDPSASGGFYAPTPAPVVGVGGSGTLTGVASLVSDGIGYCALLVSASVDCWGSSVYGALGDGLPEPNQVPYSDATPHAVAGVGGTGVLTGVVALEPDTYGYCALLTGGSVDCWGYGGDGELGDGSRADAVAPVRVQGIGGVGSLAGATQLSGFGDGMRALVTGGGIVGWGANADGRLGNGTTTDSLVPTAVVGPGGSGLLTGATSVTAGNADTCAVLSAGAVDCWGAGGLGTVGDDSTANSSVPVPVSGTGGTGHLSGVASLVAGLFSFCAVLTTGEVSCWGGNASGALGDGATADSDVPEAVRGINGTGVLGSVVRVVDQPQGYCALLVTTAVDCWGVNYYGQLGNGTNNAPWPCNCSDTPTSVVQGAQSSSPLTGVSDLASDESVQDVASSAGPQLSAPGNTCVVLPPGGVSCWGTSGGDEIGPQPVYAVLAPVPMPS